MRLLFGLGLGIGPLHGGARELALQVVVGVSVIISIPTAGFADCFCMFANGVLQPICGSSLDVRPHCGPFYSPKPLIVQPVMPPPAELCSRVVVCDDRGRHCRRRVICGPAPR